MTTGISRRTFMAGLGAGAGALALSNCAGRRTVANKRPNILLVTTDDQGIEAGCYGDPFARTPNMDRLAAEGMLFRRAYVTQASCSPSRSSIFTGQYPHQNGQIGLAHLGYSIEPDIPTLPSLLAHAGYQTGVIGKVHVAPLDAFHWDWERKDSQATLDVRGVAAQAQDFINTCDGKPFFLMVNYFDPHRPYENVDQVKGLPVSPLKPQDVTPFPFLAMDHEGVRQEVATYYNCVERADAGLGMLLDRLEVSGLLDDTIVVFLGDHGPPFTRAKTTCYEAGVQIPLLIRWPGHIRAGRETEALVSTVDLMPTLLEAAGVVPGGPMAGTSLFPLFTGNDNGWRDVLATEYGAHIVPQYYPRRALCTHRYKIIHNLLHDRPNPAPSVGLARLELTPPGTLSRDVYERFINPPEFELYDLRHDPYEFRDLSGNENFTGLMKDMRQRLERWRDDTADPLLDPDCLRRQTQRHDELARQGTLVHWSE